MSIRYRVIHKSVVSDGMMEKAALELLEQVQYTYPENKYIIEEYQYTPPEGKLFGRDPDLH